MAFISIFDVIGPNMVGPSSSHTSGACAISFMAKKIFSKNILKVSFTLYGSFAKTYRGHGTDKALLGGILGFSQDDLRIRESFAIAEESGIKYEFIESEIITEHPNTVDICMESDSGEKMSIRGVSIGGGQYKIVRINNVEFEFLEEYPTLIINHKNEISVISYIKKCIENFKTTLDLIESNNDKNVNSIIKFNGEIPENLIDKLKENSNILSVTLIQI